MINRTNLKRYLLVAAIAFAGLFLLLLLAISALYSRSYLRPYQGVVLVLDSVALVVSVSLFAYAYIKKHPRVVQSLVLVLFCLLSFSTVSIYRYRLASLKERVLTYDKDKLRRFGNHFIVGFDTFADVAKLVEKDAIGGIFISQKNIKGRTFDQVREDINNLQTIRKNHGLLPLLIATDQEGGIVSRLSGLVKDRESLGDLVKSTGGDYPETVALYAEEQSDDLKNLGVNLNFSPVVDVTQNTQVKNDSFTMLSKRAISSDPQIVTEAAKIYCEKYRNSGVKATLKHFPGLGKARVDTHKGGGTISGSYEDIKDIDLKPFLEIPKSCDPFIMLSHITWDTYDKENPVSISKAVIQNILRHRMLLNNILVTDDFSMGAINNGSIGVAEASVKALNAGADLILISYDPDLYYSAIDAVLAAEKSGKLDLDLVGQSDKRILKRTL